jgi:DNA polymerase-3 subunit delta'
MSTSHHALLLFASDISTADIAELKSDNEIHDIEFEKFGVNDAQQLVKAAYVRPLTTSVQFCVVRAQFITLEAQNALLKVFEEPPQSTKFLLIVPHDFIIIPTLLSRCEILAVGTSSLENLTFDEFFSASYAQRLALIDMAQKKKDVQWQRSIKKGLISYLEKHTEHLQELEYAARLLLTRGASNKFLLEHAALTLPSRIKS